MENVCVRFYNFQGRVVNCPSPVFPLPATPEMPLLGRWMRCAGFAISLYWIGTKILLWIICGPHKGILDLFPMCRSVYSRLKPQKRVEKGSGGVYIQVWGLDEPVTRFSGTLLVSFGGSPLVVP